MIAARAASCTNAGTLVTEFCWKMSIAVMRSLLATHQPMRKPVMMYVFEKVSTRIERSAMPSTAAIVLCSAPE